MRRRRITESKAVITNLKAVSWFILFVICLIPSKCFAHKPELVIQSGHFGSVESVAFSPDGHFVATGGRDNFIKLWDSATGKEFRTIAAGVGIGAIESLNFSPDGKLLASANKDGTIKLWQIPSGEVFSSFPKLSEPVDFVSFTHDGQSIVSRSLDNKIRIWDLHSKELRTLPCSTGLIERSVAFDSKNLIAMAGQDKSIQLLNIASGKEVWSLIGHAWEVRSIAFSCDGLLASGDMSGTIKLWSLSTGKQVGSLAHANGFCAVQTVSFSCDGRLLSSAGEDGIVKLWDIATGTECKRLSESDSINAVIFGPDGKTLATASSDFNARLWDISSGKQLFLLSGKSKWINSVALSPDGKILAFASSNTIKLWNLSSINELRTLVGHSDEVWSVDFSVDGRTLASGGRDGTVRLWDLTTGTEKQLRKTSQSLRRMENALFVENQIPNLVGSTIELCDISVTPLPPPAPLRRHDGFIHQVKFSPDGGLVASASDDKTVKIWNLTSCQELCSLPHSDNVYCIAFSPDGHQMVTGSRDGAVILWDLAAEKRVRVFSDPKNDFDPIYSVAFSPDGHSIAAGCWDKTIRLWDLESGKALKTLIGHTSHVKSVTFNPDGSIVSGGWDNTIKVWDTFSGEAKWTLKGHSGPVESIEQSVDGRLLVSGSYDMTIKLWDQTSEKEIASLFSFGDHDWAVVTREGRFDASQDGMNLLHWRIDNDLVDLSQLKSRFYEPGLLPKLLGFNSDKLRDISGFDNVELYPEIALEPIKEGSNQLLVVLNDRGGGIGKVLVKVNGKELNTDVNGIQRRPSADKKQEINVDLSSAVNVVPGEKNEVTVAVFNSNGYMMSRDVRVLWTPPGKSQQPPPPEFYAIVGGIADYKDDRLKLSFSDKDACDFSKALRLSADRLFGTDRVHITLLTTARVSNAVPPTKENFRKAFEAVKKAKPNDIVLIYLAGHGTTTSIGSDTYCYLTSDAYTTELVDPQIRQKTAITSQELQEWTNADKVPAKKQVLILDTCAAGAAAEQLAASRAISGDQIRAVDRLNERNGFWVLMGCTADAVSYEASKFGQGLLTHALLQGLRGAGLVEERTEKLVDVQKLFDYATEKVPELASGIGGVQKPQLMTPRGGTSFWIGKLTPIDMEAVPVSIPYKIILKPNLMGKRRDELNLTTALKAKFYDDLQTDRGTSNVHLQARYVPVDEMAGAYLASGSYTISGSSVDVDMGLTLDGNEVAAFQVTGSKDNITELASRIAEKIYRLIGAK